MVSTWRQDQHQRSFDITSALKRSDVQRFLRCLCRIAPGAAALAVSSLLCDIAGRSSFHAEANAPGRSLHDAVHSRVPDHWDHTDPSSPLYAAPDRLLLASAFVTAVMAVRNTRSAEHVAGVLGEVAILLAMLFVLRSSLIATTTIPSPVRSCVGADSLEEAQSGFDAAKTYCNDLMFSGHTACHLVLGSVWAASPTPVGVRAAVAAYVAGCMFVSVAVKDHYTMDVLVSLYVSVPLCLLRRAKLLVLFNPSG